MGLPLRGGRRSKNTKKVVAVFATLLVATAGLTGHVSVVGRIPNRPRQLMDWERRRASLSEKAFKQRYRLSKASFETLNTKIHPHLAHAERRRGNQHVVPVELCLSMSLRWLAGGSYVDIADMHGVEPSTFYDLLWKTLEAIDKVEKLNFPIGNADALRGLSEGFYRNNHESLQGCVGALDGIAVRIRKPWLVDDSCPMTFYNRKGFFAVNVQAICDADCRVQWLSCVARGSTHDSTAWAFSSLSSKLEATPLPKGYWIAADDAYPASDQLLTPWPGKSLASEKDAFNYYQSSTRISIERTFGILHARWGVLWRPLTVSLDHALLVVRVCAKLHNICIDHAIVADEDPARILPHTRRTGGYRDRDANQADGLPYPLMQSDFGEELDENQQGRRRDLEHAPLRLRLTEHLAALGKVRPPLRQRRL